MTTTETRKATPNGTTTPRTRTRKPASARNVGMKIADLLDTLPTDQRERALEIAKVLGH